MADADALGNARQACSLIAAAKLNCKKFMQTTSARLDNDKMRVVNHCIVITAIMPCIETHYLHFTCMLFLDRLPSLYTDD